LHAIEHASLPKPVRSEYNQQRPFVPIFTKERFNFVGCVFTLIKQRIRSSCCTLQTYFSRWIKPSTTTLMLGTLADMTRGKSELLAENALLRHQLIILRRQVKHPVYLKTDRFLLVVLPEWFGPGKRRFSSSSQRRFCGGIVSSSACAGNTDRKHAQASLGSRARPSL